MKKDYEITNLPIDLVGISCYDTPNIRRKEARPVFSKAFTAGTMMRCRMLISRACSVAETFGLFGVRLRMIQG